MIRRITFIAVAIGVVTAACFEDQIEKPVEPPAIVAPSGSADQALAVVSASGASPTNSFGTIGLGGGPRLPVEPASIEKSLSKLDAPASERENAAWAMLEGGEPANRLPIKATDPGVDFDFELREKVAPTPKPPGVRMGVTKVSPGLPPEVVQRIVRQNFGRFRACYVEALKNDPVLEGRVAVDFTIQKDGTTKNPKASSDDGLPKEMVACIQKGFVSLSFPAPEGEKLVTVTYPIAFTPGN